MLDPGELRHRVDIDEKTETRSTTTGAVATSWTPFATNVPASVKPVSAREFVASQALQGEVVARIVIRHREGLKANMRIRFRGEIYNPQGWLPDPDSGLEYVTAPCTKGVSDG